MKKYEYFIFNSRQLVNGRRETQEIAKSVGDEVILVSELNRLGQEGWKLNPWGDLLFFGVREIE